MSLSPYSFMHVHSHTQTYTYSSVRSHPFTHTHEHNNNNNKTVHVSFHLDRSKCIENTFEYWIVTIGDRYYILDLASVCVISNKKKYHIIFSYVFFCLCVCVSDTFSTVLYGNLKCVLHTFYFNDFSFLFLFFLVFNLLPLCRKMSLPKKRYVCNRFWTNF